MKMIQFTLATLASLTSSLVRRLWRGGCLGRTVLAVLALLLVGICAAPFGTRSAQRPTLIASAPTVAASANLAGATSSASQPDSTALPASTGAGIPPTWTPAPSLPTAPAEQAATVQPGTSQRVPTGAQRATVVRVVDGDTVNVEIDGQPETVRLIGIDTPETKHPSKAVQCYGAEASARTAELLDRQTVYLEADQSQDNRDRYGRSLRYVWLEDGTNINLQLVAEGYAFEYTYAVPYRYQADFRVAQDKARIQGLGLWAATACNGEQKPADEAPAPTVQANGPTATPAQPTPTVAPTEQPGPTTAPAPTAAAVPPPASTVRFSGCDVDPGAGSAPEAPVQIANINKKAETVTLKNVSGAAVNLAGWVMCSIKGGQQHPIGGTLAPGEQKVFKNTGGNIWNNSARDPGALYDGAGRLVSYSGG